jgi:hypothetical protein
MRIGGVGCGFKCAICGEFVVDGGDLRGSCVVIFVDEKHANFGKYIFERAVGSKGGLTVLTDDADSCLLRG